MVTKIEFFNQSQLKKGVPDVRAGDTVRVYQKIHGEGEKGKSQAFEGQIIARKHGKGVSATITVRKVISGIGVEKIFPLHSPLIEKIEILKRGRVKRAKLYYLRGARGKKARLKHKEFVGSAIKEGKLEPTDEIAGETEGETKPEENKAQVVE